MRRLRVIKPGFFTTVQDSGRYGYMKYGVPTSGAMDQFSLMTANLLVGNDPNAACLETTLTSPELQALSTTQIAITGGDCSPKIDGASVCMWRTLTLQKGETLSFGKMQSGCRAYIALRGGIDTPPVLGSRSTYVRGGFGGVNGRQLKAGDLLHVFEMLPLNGEHSMPSELVPRFKEHLEVHVILGPQVDMFTEKGIEAFLSSQYIVTTESDRMGYRLDGPLIEHKVKADIISDALMPGAIQVPKNGKPIVIMRDAQTTGGYAKIAVTITPDISKLGQAKPNDTIGFFRTTLKEARRELLEYDKLAKNVINKLSRVQ